jgi:hypothetical protein
MKWLIALFFGMALLAQKSHVVAQKIPGATIAGGQSSCHHVSIFNVQQR